MDVAEGKRTSVNRALRIVRLDAVSTMKTAGFPFATILTRIKPKTELCSKGISLLWSEACEKLGIASAIDKTTAKRYLDAASNIRHCPFASRSRTGIHDSTAWL